MSAGTNSGDASNVATGLMSDDQLRIRPQQDDQIDLGQNLPILPPMDTSLSLANDDECTQRRHYLHPVCMKFKGSIHFAFLSHVCFIIASVFYVKLGFLNLTWVKDTTDRIPREVFFEDDDAIWTSWAKQNKDDFIVDERESYFYQSKLLYTLGAFYFVVVGILDWMRYCDCLNMFMILAGVGGMISGFSETRQTRNVWDCISVHMYLFEAINLLHRDHDYEGHPCFRMSDILFLLGCLLDIGGSYLGIGGVHWVGIVYMDIISTFLWLGCALIDLTAEMYFLKKHSGGGRIVLCY